MSSDSRWTGGAANRQWQAGTRLEPPVDTEYLTWQVRYYLTDCRRFKHLIGPAHPTEEGVLKIVFHTGDAQKQAVLEAFRARTAPRRPEGADRG